MGDLIVVNNVETKIFVIRGQKVMIDRDLAGLYEIPTYRLNEAVKRNIERFPVNFMFKLTDIEFKELIAICDRFKTLKHSTSAPYAFTEYGVAMLSSVLNSKKAIAINIEIIEAFIRLKNYALSQSGTNEQIAELRKLLMLYIEKNDKRVNEIIIALNNLIASPPEPKEVGFRVD